MRDDWRRATKRNPCPSCGQGDGCELAIDGGAHVCRRIEAGSVRPVGSWAWLHVTREASPQSYHKTPSKPKAKMVVNWDSLTRFFQSNVNGQLPGFARRLGVSAAALTALGVGLIGRTVWTFPMRDHDGTVIGIRTRQEGGEKRAIKDSKSGLMYPLERQTNGTVYVCEGQTDTAALLTLGLDAIGRASCGEGAAPLSKMLAGCVVVVIADNDGPGVRGAVALARALQRIATVRIIAPPTEYNDVRDWVRGGATKRDVETSEDRRIG